MRKGLVAILFLVCGVLLAGNVVAYVGEDHSGPEISIPEEAVTYVEGTDTSMLLTGVTAGRSVLCVGAQRGQDGYTVRTPLLRPFHGTGDIFGAAMVGRLLQGNAPQAAAQAAAVFVGDCLRATPEGADERLGVWLESVLPRLLPAGES